MGFFFRRKKSVDAPKKIVVVEPKQDLKQDEKNKDIVEDKDDKIVKRVYGKRVQPSTECFLPRSFKLLKELDAGEKGSHDNMWISYGLNEGEGHDMFEWHATIIGPQDTVLGDRVYSLKIYCPKRYPYVPPQVAFKTKINMACVDQKDGNIKENSVQAFKNWKYEHGIIDILINIRQLMAAAAKLKQPLADTEYEI